MIIDQSYLTKHNFIDNLPESVMVSIISCFEFEIHKVHGGSCTRDKEDLHGGVVERHKVGDQVQVAGHEHYQEQHLALARDT